MTVIAWDGKTLAADKQSTTEGMRRTTTKIHRVGLDLVAFTGDGGHAALLLAWFQMGRPPGKFPRAHDEDNVAHAVRFSSEGVLVYNGHGTGGVEVIEDPFIAFGHGRDYAMAAMHLGKSAKEAVAVACHFDTYCGMGIDTLTLKS